MLESPWSELTREQLVALFDRHLTDEEQQEIIDFKLDSDDTLAMICATLEQNGIDSATVLRGMEAEVADLRSSD